MRSFFSLSHAGATDHSWPGVYFHGHLVNEVRYRLSLAALQGAPDLVASREPLVSLTLGPPIEPHGARAVVSRTVNVANQAGTLCDVYGLCCALYLWCDLYGTPHGLICLDRDSRARDYAFGRFQARADFL